MKKFQVTGRLLEFLDNIVWGKNYEESVFFQFNFDKLFEILLHDAAMQREMFHIHLKSIITKNKIF